MKKKIVVMMLCLALVSAMTGCGKETDNAAANSSSSNSAVSDSGSVSESIEDIASSSIEAVDGIPVVEEALSVSECVTLGDYKGLQLEKKTEQVTDEQIDASIEDSLLTTVDDPEATVQDGDTVDIAFVGKLDGEAFDGGSSDSYNLVIGSHSFIDGFEEGCIGMKADETKDLNLKFPDVYQNNPDLAGKDVVFTVTVNAISRPAELTDEWAAANTDYDSAEAYRQGKREELEAANALTAQSDLEDLALQTAVSNATVSKIPSSYIGLGEKMYDAMFQTNYAMVAAYYGMEMDEFIETYMGQEQYDAEKANYAKNVAKSYLVLLAIRENEGWTSEDEDFVSRLNTYAENAGMTAEEFVEQSGEENVDFGILMEQVTDLVLANATITETTVDASGNAVD